MKGDPAHVTSHQILMEASVPTLGFRSEFLSPRPPSSFILCILWCPLDFIQELGGKGHVQGERRLMVGTSQADPASTLIFFFPKVKEAVLALC